MARNVLVSGATGYIAGHVIEQLLAAGNTVTGTVRDPNDKGKTAHLLAMPGAERLSLVAADLTDPDPFTAHADVDAILHLASPYVINVQDAQRDLVDPAVQGTLSMLRAAAANPRVKRIVLTSSMAAVTDNPDGRVLTDADWNTTSSLVRNPYYYSKTLAERAAWEFMEREKPGLDLVAINPFLVIGPSHTKAVNTSPQTLVDMLKGTYPAVMALTWGFVDVRDVAAAHVAAMNRPEANGRYLCVAANMSMAETAALMRAEGYAGRLPKLDLSGGFGTALMKLASYTQPKGAGSYLRTHLGQVPRYDATRVTRELGVSYRPVAQSLQDTLADLARWGHIPAAAR
ncbi:SDR family oxidoreductase [Tabrizicola sp.]|uniref:SDR family oxidoreductase n=1 Tax=Tabrizicola sp. TaxID=2005166 RepID=UPI003F2C88DF